MILRLLSNSLFPRSKPLVVNTEPIDLPPLEPLIGSESRDASDSTFIRLRNKMGIWVQLTPLISPVVKTLVTERYTNVRYSLYLLSPQPLTFNSIWVLSFALTALSSATLSPYLSPLGQPRLPQQHPPASMSTFHQSNLISLNP